MKIILKNSKGEFWSGEAGWVNGIGQAKAFEHVTDVVELSLQIGLERGKVLLWFGPDSPMNTELDAPSAKAVARIFRL